MAQIAESLTEEDVTRLVGDLGHVTVAHLVGVLGARALAGEFDWALREGRRDPRGASLAYRVRSGATLTVGQVASVREDLLPRNWQAVRSLMTRDIVRVPDSLILAIQQTRPAPPTPQPVADCGKKLFYSSNTCTMPEGHSGGCVGEAEQAVAAPTSDVDSVLSQGFKNVVPVSKEVSPPWKVGTDAQAKRFALVIEAAWDDVKAAPLQEEGPDASVERFLLLDLD